MAASSTTHTQKKMARQLVEDAKEEKNKKNFAATLASDGCDQSFLILGDLQREGMGTHNTCMHTMRRRRLIDSPAALCVNSCLLFWKTIGGQRESSRALSSPPPWGSPFFFPLSVPAAELSLSLSS
jgi:hypothetical protein